MKHLNLLTTTIAVCLCLLTGCQKDDKTDASVDTQTGNKITGRPSTQLSLQPTTKLRRMRLSLPANYRSRLEKNTQRLLSNPEYRDFARKALAIEPTTCNATDLALWLNGEISDWEGDIAFFAIYTGILDFPATEALLFENRSANQYFGVKGEYSQRIQKTFKDLKRFWNIQSDDIVLAGMHGSILQNREKLIQTDMAIYGDDEITATYFADLILNLLKEVPQYRNGSHPMFTFNAFAQQSFDFPPVGKIPNKIVIGDGILDGFSAIGFKDIAPQAILAHEFAHQIQFQLGLSGNINTPEASRRTELMADAYSAYYLSHARGASMQWKRVQQFLQVFFNIGDCSFDSNGHHGTPSQRMAAARWAYNLANNAQKQGHIMTSQQFSKLFSAALPAILLQ